MSIFGWEEFDVTSSFVHFQPWIPWILRQGTPTKTGSTRDHFHPLTPFSPGSRGPLKACVCAWQVKTSRFQQQSEWKKQFDIFQKRNKSQIQKYKITRCCTVVHLFFEVTWPQDLTVTRKKTPKISPPLGWANSLRSSAWRVRLLGGSIILIHIGVSKNRGTPKSSILIGFSMFSIINHPFWSAPIFGNTHI